jgi:hypothetical protein
VGSLIAPYAEFMAQLVKIQDKIEAPVGAVLKEMGEKLADTQFIGGPEFLAWLRKKKRQLKKIERIGSKLDARYSSFQNTVIEMPQKIVSTEPLNISN